MRQRNHAADHIIFSYFGAAAMAALDQIGPFALKRATYQSMLSAALYIKNEIEAYRASNIWGSTFWQVRLTSTCSLATHLRIQI